MQPATHPATHAKERSTGTGRFVRDMIDGRQEMWVLYCKVAGLQPFREPGRVPEVLERFCQVLVDYISTGHFGLYERIAAGCERRREVRDVAAEVYGRIAQTTDIAVRFNDTYDGGAGVVIGPAFARDLSELGEALALRIELEDRILERLR